MNKSAIHVAMAFFLVACSGGRDGGYDEVPEIVRIKKKTPYHTVNEGETVGDIATRYDMTRSELVKLNDLQPPYQLYTGQRLLIKIRVDSGSDVQSVEGRQAKLPDAKRESSDAKEKEKVTGPGEIEQEIPRFNDAIEETVTDEYEWPVADAREKIVQHFGDDGADGGIIIDTSAGTPVKAIADGIVVISGIPGGEAAAYGLTVVIKHPGKKKMSIYANLQEAAVAVKDEVKRGDVLGKAGKSGAIAKKAQLYLEIRAIGAGGNKAVDPEKLLP
jgi:lipoprotein NlpD